MKGGSPAVYHRRMLQCRERLVGMPEHRPAWFRGSLLHLPTRVSIMALLSVNPPLWVPIVPTMLARWCSE